MRIALLLLLFFISFSGFSAIYQWKDKNGVTVFSDVPHEHAKEISLTPAQIYHSRVSQSVTDTQAEKKKSTEVYKSIAFTKLKDRITIRNNNAESFNVDVILTPTLKDDDEASLYVDRKSTGTPVKGPSETMNFTLKNVDRGAHKLQVSVINKQTQKVIISTKTITVYFQQASIIK